MAISLERFIQQIEETGIIAGDTLKDFIPPKGTSRDAEDLARELVRQRKLTKYQAEEVYRGNGKSLTLGNYVLMEKIGAGGMGQVFKAEHRRMKRIVAIKLLPSAMTKDKEAIARFEREVEAAAKISHPNVVAAFDADCANSVHFLVMELVEGSDLSALVKKNGPFSVGKTISYILQAARGLESAHKKGIVHRDIKPANLLLDSEGTVKILDMGLARLNSEADALTQAELTSTGTVMGTVDYMAPEQALNTKTADARADIYALGCTLWYLLTGRSIYDGDTLMAKLLAHRDQPIPSLRLASTDVPESLDAVFRKMVAKKTEDRYQNMTQLIVELERCRHRDDATVIQRDVVLPVAQSDMMDILRDRSVTQAPAVNTTPTGNDKKKLLISGGLLAALILLAGIVVSLKTKDGTLVVTVNEPDADVQVLNEAGKVEVTRKGEKGPITIAVDPGKHRLKVSKEGFEFFTQDFTIESGGEQPITAKLVPLEVKPEMSITKAAVAEVKKPLFFQTAEFEPWAKEVAAMPAEQQVEAVSKKLMELNPGCDGKLGGMDYGVDRDVLRTPTPTIEKGVVTRLFVLTDNVSDISPIRALQGLERLVCVGTYPPKGRFSDLSPLKGMKLQEFSCGLNPMLSSLEPLRGMRLNYLSCYGCPISDISPLKGMPLSLLTISRTLVADVTPLKDMPLEVLYCQDLQIADISPLKGMPLHTLWLHGTKVSDFSLLKDMPLKNLWLDFNPNRDTELLRSLKDLEKINYKPAAEFWKEVAGNKPLFFQTPSFDQWVREVSVLAPEQQVEAVSKKLMELNPGFDGTVKHSIENGVVTFLSFRTDKVTDISPIRGIHGLRSLDISSSSLPNGMLADLTPLRGMSLIDLNIPATSVVDLSPLRRMPLIRLNCSFTQVSDLSPLDDSPLRVLSCVRTLVSDLGPLRSKQLTNLRFELTQVTDVSFLRGMPLQVVSFDLRPKRDIEWLRSLTTLQEINSKPAADFWKDVAEYSDPVKTLGDPEFQRWLKDVAHKTAEDQVVAVAKKLQELNPSFDGKVEHTIDAGVVTSLKFVSDNVWNIAPIRVLSGLKTFDCSGSNLNGREGKVADLSPLSGLPLTELRCVGTLVYDLSPLKGMPLNKIDYGNGPGFDLTPLQGMPLIWLNFGLTPLSDLTPIQGLPLKYLQIDGTHVTDLSPLRGMPLTQLYLREVPISDLTPLAGMPLGSLACQDSNVTDLTQIKDLPITYLGLDFQPTRDTTLLRSMPTLRYINDKPVAEFWNDVEAERK